MEARLPFYPALSSILFLEISLKMHSLQPYLSLCPILKHCRGETGTISQQSTKSWVHLGMCSDLVSTFCCSHADINHSAVPAALSPPRSLAASPPQARGHSGSGLFISSEWELLIPPVSLIPFLSFGFCAIYYNSPWTSSHDCPLSALQVRRVWMWVWQLFSELPEDGAILIFLRHIHIICIISFLSTFDLFPF